MTGAKPLYRFRDRALAGLMAARGWKGDCLLTVEQGRKPPRLDCPGRQAPLPQPSAISLREIANTAATE